MTEHVYAIKLVEGGWTLETNGRRAIQRARKVGAQVWSRAVVPGVLAWDWPTFVLGATLVWCPGMTSRGTISVLWAVDKAYRLAVGRGLVGKPEDSRLRAAAHYYGRNRRNPGDCAGDDAMLLGLAIAEAHVGHGIGWIPEVQRIGAEIAKIL